MFAVLLIRTVELVVAEFGEVADLMLRCVRIEV